jgi:ribonuclease HII
VRSLHRVALAPAKLQLEAASLSRAARKLRFLKRLRCTLSFERKAWKSGACRVAGVDEAGRGSLFGPVVAAAVILDPERRIRGLRDSKLISEKVREELVEQIRERALACAVAEVDAAEIDRINIYQASRLAMRAAVAQLAPAPDHLLVDAMVLDWACPQTRIIHGDARSASVAAASILAKVERDRLLRHWDGLFPQYGLAAHKGYSTPQHLESLRLHGPSPMHRQTFAPVWDSTRPQEVLEFMLDAEAEPLAPSRD